MEVRDAMADIEAAPKGAKTGAFFDDAGTVFYAGGRCRGRARRQWGAAAPLDDVAARAEEHYLKRLSAAVYPEARALVAAHRRWNHTVVLVSTAPPEHVAPLQRDLQIDHLASVETSEGRDGTPAATRQAIKAFAATHGLDLRRAYAYADDVALLETVGRPHATNPTPALETVAAERGWPVLRLSGRGPVTPALVARNVAAYATFAGSMAVGAAVGILNRNKRDAINTFVGLAGDLVLAAAGVGVRVVGEEHLWSHRPAVFTINHQSGIDALLLFRLVRQDVTGVGKKELAKNPLMAVMGWLLDVAWVDRSNTTEAVASLNVVAEQLRRGGRSILISPEGTRSPGTKVGPFKKGAFRLAMAANVPVVPIVVRNSNDVQPSRSLVMRPGSVDVIVLAPVPTADWTLDDLDERIERVHRLYVDTLDRWPGAEPSPTPRRPTRPAARTERSGAKRAAKPAPARSRAPRSRRTRPAARTERSGAKQAAKPVRAKPPTTKRARS